MNTRFIASFQVLLAQDETGLSADSKAQTELIRTVSVDRIGNYIGTLSRNKVWELDEALKVHLNL
ncbi:type II toxin-antitoxin system PemK/MazF family toxin [Rothia nasimurium]|uniref:type II toxin-antitoxin system PemK/MazF family toxin n=1 Tax=Rothia nasimurium TaxID=85336 RepID=UPI003C6DE435